MVEWKKLGEVAHYYRGVTYNKQQEVSLNSGGTRILRANNINIGINTLNYDDVKEISKEVKIKNYQWLYKEDILICAGSGSKEHVGKVAYIKEDLDYAYGGFMGKIVTDNSLIPRYLFHIISGLMFKKYLEIALNSTTINNLNSDIIYNFEIPVPSLSEQTRIVGILDTFTASIENLKEQIAERRKQYEHYRDQLLDLEGKEGVEIKTLGDVCDFIRGPFGGALKKDMFVSNGYAIYEQQHAIYGVWNFRYFIDENKYNQMKRFKVEAGDILMSCSGTMGKTSIVPYNYKEGIINQALLKLSTKDDISNKYLKQFMDSQLFQDALKGKTAGGAIQNVASVSVLKDLTIPLPPLQEQQRIVSILDTFEASIQNLEAQLKQRQKQYEYYRNKLLTFE